ncbi:MAG: hypothetical protein ABI680_20045 [Chthoniobacteraceae bacterium]
MTSEEAKLILNAARPSGKDDDDPVVAGALSVVHRDPELTSWLAQTRDFDGRLSTILRGHEAPPWLLEHILAGSSLESRARRNRSVVIGAIAAALALLLSIATWRMVAPTQPRFGEMRNFVAEFVGDKWDHSFTLDQSDFQKINTWLAHHPGMSKMEVSQQLAKSSAYGCKVIDWEHRKISLVCFDVEGMGAIVHVLATPKAGLKNVPGPEPVYAEAGGFNSASWTKGDTVYVALTQASKGELASLL